VENIIFGENIEEAIENVRVVDPYIADRIISYGIINLNVQKAMCGLESIASAYVKPLLIEPLDITKAMELPYDIDNPLSIAIAKFYLCLESDKQITALFFADYESKIDSCEVASTFIKNYGKHNYHPKNKIIKMVDVSQVPKDNELQDEGELIWTKNFWERQNPTENSNYLLCGFEKMPLSRLLLLFSPIFETCFEQLQESRGEWKDTQFPANIHLLISGKAECAYNLRSRMNQGAGSMQNFEERLSFFERFYIKINK